MFFRVVKTEILKLRRAPVWIAFFVLPMLAAVMGTFNYLQNLGILKKEWYSLWTQHTLFSSYFFLPALIGVLCAYEWRLEHRENNWNQLMSAPTPAWMPYCGKLLISVGFAFLTLLWTGVLFILGGKYAGLSGPPPAELIRWLALGGLAAAAVASVQLLFSMIIRSFAIPVGFSLMGGIVGLAMANYGYGLYCPYALLAIGMNANGRGFLKLEDTAPFLVSCAAFTLFFTAIAVGWLKRRDVKTS